MSRSPSATSVFSGTSELLRIHVPDRSDLRAPILSATSPIDSSGLLLQAQFLPERIQEQLRQEPEPELRHKPQPLASDPTRQEQGLQPQQEQLNVLLLPKQQTTPAQATPAPIKNLGRHYTSWGTEQSLGSVVNTSLQYLTLSTPARTFGNWVQGGHDSGARYWVGASIKGLASVTGSAASLVGGVVSVGETIVSNAGEATLRLAGAGIVGTAGVALKVAGVASSNADQAGTKMLNTATDLASGISLLNKGEQSEVTAKMAEDLEDIATLAKVAYYTNADSVRFETPEEFRQPVYAYEIPEELRSIENKGTGKVAKLTYDQTTGNLSGDRWSAINIRVVKKMKNQPGAAGIDNKPTYYLAFPGVRDGGSLKSAVVQALGIEDSAFQEADAIVRAFVKEHGAKNVKLIGHSLGGALAQWAGIRNGVHVTAFNSAGLHVHMRNRLGAERLNNADVDHFNTEGDPLSQYAEGRRTLFDASAQVGNRFVIPDTKGHLMDSVLEGLFRAKNGG
jgi:hypothetical protein